KQRFLPELRQGLCPRQQELSKSNASCLNYAKGCARGSRSFLKATLLADFTPRAVPAAVGAF
ncbi:hypothetical protein, partial [Acinetobacter bereziniae]|uniref:hypothetical protein n=1 Tax=Acinetobacter bereziniae TaxID=106648 RepID=UPI001C658897